MNSFFGIGIMELFVIAILAMIVLGPERLPGLIREGAKWMRQIRRITSDLTSQFSEELHALDEINPQRILREITDPEQDEPASKPKPAAKAASAPKAKPAAKPAPAKSATTSAKPAAKTTSTKPPVKAAAPSSAQAEEAAVDAAAASATAAGVAAVDSSTVDAATVDVSQDGSAPDEDNRILPAQPAPAAGSAAQGDAGAPPPGPTGGAVSPPDSAAGPAESAAAPAQRKSTIGDPRPLMARAAAQKAENNGAPSAAAVNGGKEQSHPEAASAPAAQADGQPAEPSSAVASEIPARVVDGASPGLEGEV